MPITRRVWLRTAATLPAAAAAQPVASKASRPNIVILHSDDQTYRSIHVLNCPDIQTPNLDRLSARGTAFTSAFIMGGLQGAVCVPSRAMLMSGQTLFHATANVVRQPDYGPAREGVVLMPQVFAKAGYDTIGIGKWHLGPKLYTSCFSGGGPMLFGGMGDHYGTPLWDFSAEGNYGKDRQRKGTKHSSEIFADAAIAAIEKRDRNRPLFLYCAFTAPHDPRQAPPEYKALYPEKNVELPPNFLPEHPFDNGEMKVRDEALLPWPRTKEAVRKERSDYYAMITHLDSQVGRVLDTIDRQGMAANTIIVFCGDNGLAVGQHGLLGKQNLYDHSVRVPFIMAGPGVPVNQRRAALVCLFDIFPTLCDMAGIDKPETIDGKALTGVLRNPLARIRDAVPLAYRHFQRGLRTERWKYARYNVGGVQHTQLFDLTADPWEMRDLSADQAHAATVQNLERRMRNLLRQEGDPLDFDQPDWGWKPAVKPA